MFDDPLRNPNGWLILVVSFVVPWLWHKAKVNLWPRVSSAARNASEAVARHENAAVRELVSHPDLIPVAVSEQLTILTKASWLLLIITAIVYVLGSKPELLDKMTGGHALIRGVIFVCLGIVTGAGVSRRISTANRIGARIKRAGVLIRQSRAENRPANL